MLRRLCLVLPLIGPLLAACKGESGTATPPSCTVSGVTISPAASSVPVGGTNNLAATVAQQNCSNLTPTWASANPAIASVTQGGVVTGVAAGTAAITATAAGVVGNATVTVTAPVCTVSNVLVNPTSPNVFVGDSVVLRANIGQQNCTGLVPTWTSANPAVATVTPAGVVTAVAPGTVSVSAAVSGVSGSAIVVVTRAPLGAQWTLSTLRVVGSDAAPVTYNAAGWAASPTDLFVASSYTMHRYSNGVWTQSDGSGVTAMWGTSATDVFGVGFRMARWNGSTWTFTNSPTSQTLRAIWGSSSSQVFAAGDGGVIVRFDGTSWSTMTSPVTTNIRGISGSGPSFALAVTASSQVLRWDGTTWTTQTTPAQFLNGVWVSSPTLAFAVGNNAVFRFNGTAWTSETLPNVESNLTAVWGSSATDVYAAGTDGVVLHYDGSSWVRVPQVTRSEALAVTGSGSTAFVLGRNFVATANRSTQTLLSYAPKLNAVWAIDDNTAFAVGESGIVWRYNNGSWRRLDTGVFHNLRDVWAASANRVFAVGDNPSGTAAMLQYDGSTWSEVSLPPSGFLSSIAGGSSARAVAVSPFSPLLTWDGNTWRAASGAMPSDKSGGIWGTSPSDYLIVGSSGYAVRFDGVSAITPVAAVPSQRALVTVWGSDPNNYFVGTNNGELFRFNGTSWNQITVPAAAAWRVWGSGASNLFTLSLNGTVGRYDGATWTQLRSPSGNELLWDLHGTANRLFAVGDGGVVMVTR